MSKNILHKSLKFFTGYDTSSLQPEDASFVSQWLTDYGRRIVHNQARASTVSYLLAAACAPFIVPPPFDTALTLVLVVIGLESVGWLILEPSLSKKNELMSLRIHAFLANALAFLGMSIFMYGALTHDNYTTAHLIIAGMLWGGLGWNFAIFTPVVGYSNIYFLFGLYGSTLAVTYYIGAEDFDAVAYVVMLLVVTLAGFFIAQFSGIREHALLKRQTMELESQNQILKLRAIETEMQLAAQLQANLAPPPAEVDDAQHRVRFFHVQYGILGGDLLLARDLRDGSQVIAVGDVTGKGVPAAMVVQVLHSLWADQLHIHDFSPIEWLNMVNKTLLTIGSKPGTHTLTLGLLVIHANHADYYCAGHLPVYLRSGNSPQPKFKPIFGIGMPLGIVDHMEISPVTIQLPKADNYTLLLGSDGILDWETRKHQSRLNKLIDSIDQRGIEALREHPVDDDKILVAISDSNAA